VNPVPDFNRQAGLADPACADDGEQLGRLQTLDDHLHVGFAPDQSSARRQAAHRAGKAAHRHGCHWLFHQRLLALESLDRRDEGVTDAHLRADVAGTLLAIAENSPQAGHVKAQAAFFHDHIRPDSVDQFALGQHPARTLEQRNQQVQRPSTDLDGSTVAGQQPLARRHAERAEGKAQGEGFVQVVQG